jgi:RNA polymerase sigma-54 factor
VQTALRICRAAHGAAGAARHPRLAQLCSGDSEAHPSAAIALIARLEPKPGRRFVDVERNIVVPDVIVVRIGKAAAQPKFRVQLNPDVMPRLRVHDIYASALQGHKGEAGTRRCSSACRRRAGSSRTSSSALTPSCA